jgi:phage head maturation protease
MSRGDLDQMSIGFRVTRQEWNGDYTERQIREVELFDVSVVTFPASPTTTANLRAIDDLLAAFTAGGDYDEADVRRAIAALEARLAAREAEVDPFAARDAADSERLERLRLLRPEFLAA